jgi:hypothetical protein
VGSRYCGVLTVSNVSVDGIDPEAVVDEELEVELLLLLVVALLKEDDDVEEEDEDVEEVLVMGVELDDDVVDVIIELVLVVEVVDFTLEIAM